jgi:hypothetical protein
LLFTCIALGIIQSVSRGIKNQQEAAEKLVQEQINQKEPQDEPEVYN